ncbi:hypothetical protein DRW41_00090 [Neobacillus piezotolerans]|uniref:DUF4317 domain-containing protein n=1 Tax=Neobacillus piezotolerans TaxID=2259171 RepID=A0A3D8GU60_9BACI|nr:DUF4317 domain-containing protein [Neobacillus piezotolerans]RDU38014.1 hypothetical protein DRW41_00090 [Neobacillus piezotolerans]
MNNKDVSTVRKQFKIDNERLNITEIFNVYVKKETSEIYHMESHPFGMLEQFQQELFMENFKKVVAGQLDSKLFDLKFRRGEEGSTQTILFESLHYADTAAWQEGMLAIVAKLFDGLFYEMDTVVTFIRGEFRIQTRMRSTDSEEGGDDEVFAHKFILCSLNRTDQPKSALIFDYIEKAFKASSAVDPIINLSAPMFGFLFPTFNQGAADVNHILYSAGKPNQPSPHFVEHVLSCEPINTAKEEKDNFEQVLQTLIGEKVETEVLSNIYSEINKVVKEAAEAEEIEAPMLDYHDVERILADSGVKDITSEKVEFAFKNVLDNEKKEIKASSLVPKTVKINTKVATVTISPEDLKNVRYVTINGKRCLLLEVEEDAVVEGFQLENVSL